MTTNQIKTIFFLLIILILFILVFLIFKPFLNVILWSTLISIIVSPLYKKVIKKIGFINKSSLLKNFVAAIFSIFVILIIVTPFIFIVYNLSIEFKQFSSWIDKILINNQKISFDKINRLIENLIYKISGVSVSFNLMDEIVKIIKTKTLELTPIVTAIVSKTVNTIIGIFFMIITIYFILTDGDILIKYFKDVIPIENTYLDSFITKFNQVMKIIIKGYFAIGLYQSVTFFIILMIFKYSNPFLFSSLVFITSFIPMLGATVVWLPIAILIGLSQGLIKGIIFGVLCGLIVSTFDNFLRPLIISSEIKIHPLLLFFAILGGIIAFGYNGILLGPLFLALLFSGLEIIKMQK